MRKVYSLVILVASLLAGLTASASETLTLSVSKMSMPEAAAEVVVKVQDLWKDTDIILVGEHHPDRIVRQVFAVGALSAMQNMTEKKCVFNEWSPNYQPTFDALTGDIEKAKAMYRATFEAEREEWTRIMGHDPGDHMDLDVFKFYSDNKFKVIASDYETTPERQEQLGAAMAATKKGDNSLLEKYAVWERTQAFADTIKANKTNCEKSIGIFGDGHIVNMFGNNRDEKYLPAILKAQGLRAKTVMVTQCSSVEKCSIPLSYPHDLIIQLVP